MKFNKLSRRRAVFAKYNYLGIAGAVAGFCLSFLPSLLPRPWLFQGIVTGFSLAIGYGCGTTVSWASRWLLEWEPSAQIKRWSWRLLSVVGPVAAIIYLVLSTRWQNQVRALVEEPPQNHRFVFRILFVAIITGLILLYTSRLIRYSSRHLINLIDKVLPRKISIIAGIAITAYLVTIIFNGIFFSSFVRFANKTYSQQNDGTPIGATQPRVAERSGSSASLASWSSLGYQGRGFVGRGPSQAELTKLNGQTPKQPIRVYAGLKSAPDSEARAALVVKELERTKAFDRQVLVIANATGTGWLEPQAVDSLEYMYAGDTAIASIQYSYLPSWLSFLVDKQNAKDAGQQLFNAVYGKWASLPEGKRPKLITYGLSLGSYAGQAAFSGANDLKYTTDGALFVGTPSDTELWNTITSNRDAGSRQIEPIYKKGQSIRFDDDNIEPDPSQANWQSPRILYLQHASDPIVWFDFDLILNKPDWLSEQRGNDVSPSMQWYPFITFTQVGLDQFLGGIAKNGHGHNYADQIVEAWAAIVPPADWTQQKSQALQKIIDTYPTE